MQSIWGRLSLQMGGHSLSMHCCRWHRCRQSIDANGMHIHLELEVTVCTTAAVQSMPTSSHLMARGPEFMRASLPLLRRLARASSKSSKSAPQFSSPQAAGSARLAFAISVTSRASTNSASNRSACTPAHISGRHRLHILQDAPATLHWDSTSDTWYFICIWPGHHMDLAFGLGSSQSSPRCEGWRGPLACLWIPW